MPKRKTDTPAAPRPAGILQELPTAENLEARAAALDQEAARLRKIAMCLRTIVTHDAQHPERELLRDIVQGEVEA